MQFSIGDITFKVIDDTHRLAGTGTYTNSGPNAVDSKFGPKLKIPEKVENNGVLYAITEIGPYSFYDIRTIKEVYIPSSIEVIREFSLFCVVECLSLTFGANSKLKEIKEKAMYGMNNLKKLKFTGTYLKEIGPSSLSYIYFLESLVIPSSVISIGANALCGLSYIKSIRYCGNEKLGTDILTSHTPQNSQTNKTVLIYVRSDYLYSFFGNRNDIIKSNNRICNINGALTCKRCTKSSFSLIYYCCMLLLM
jgi:hypothetical protein